MAEKFVNEGTGKIFDSLLQWGQDIVGRGEHLKDYLSHFKNCTYIIETLDNGTIVESDPCQLSGFDYYRYMYRGCDGKIYGYYYTNYTYEEAYVGADEFSNFLEFEIRKVVTYKAFMKCSSQTFESQGFEFKYPER